MSGDLKTDSVPDAPREVIDDQEEATSLPVGMPSEENNDTENVDKNYLHPPKEPSFTAKKKRSPKSMPKMSKNKEDDEKKKKKSRSPEPSIIQQFQITNSNGIHIGPNYNVNIDKSATTTKSPNAPKETKTIRGMLDSKIPVRNEHIRAIQLHVGENWKDVGRKLGFSDGNLFQIKADHDREGMKEVIYQMLLQWIQIKGSDATIGELTSALWNSSEYSAVKELAVWTKQS